VAEHRFILKNKKVMRILIIFKDEKLGNNAYFDYF